MEIIAVAFVFVTAATYSQLALAVMLYPLIIFTAFKIFPPIKWRSGKIAPKPVVLKTNDESGKTPETKREPVTVADIDKRTFIKLIGATGISFFIFSLLGRRAESMLFTGRETATPFNPNQYGPPARQPEANGYKISEIDEGNITYYGFTSQEGAWMVMRQDTNENTFRYAKGDSNFPASWQNRANLKYDYFYNLN